MPLLKTTVTVILWHVYSVMRVMISVMISSSRHQNLAHDINPYLGSKLMLEKTFKKNR